MKPLDTNSRTRKPLRVLHVEDNPHDRELIHGILEAEGLIAEIIAVQNRSEFILALDTKKFDLILSDQSLPAFDGTTALQMAQERCPEIPFIFVTGSMGEESAIQMMKSGATDYVLKDRIARLIPAVQRA